MNIKLKNIQYVFFPILIIYFELIFKIFVFEDLLNISLLNIVLFSIPMGLLLCIFSSAFNNKINKIFFILFIFLLTFIYGSQILYNEIFSTFFSMYSVIGASDAIQFMDVVKSKVIQDFFPLFLLVIPLLFVLVCNKKINFEAYDKNKLLKILGTATLVQTAALVLVLNTKEGVLSNSYLYKEAFIIDMSVEKFGLLTTERLDLKNIVINYKIEHENAYAAEPKQIISEENNENKEDIKEVVNNIENDEQIQYDYNVLNVDFNNLIQNETNETLKNMHEYFKEVEPTKKNEYTGKFKGKNLIFITAESFSPYAIDKNLTPTLYKMYEEGFKFNNFYTPLWGVSTTDGEYVACTSLIPKAGIWSFYRSAQNYMPFVMGNQLKKLNYKTVAYHNHSYDYYFRNESHPNMGYIYKGLGNGLNVTETWPESDLEMIDLTINEFINNQPFHTYYMTVSGHLQYTFAGNSMAYKNKAAVENLNYSEAIKAYLATNIELDKAMEKLIQRLEKEGIADDTLIAISPDHYPYGLKLSEINEIAGHEVETNFELYKSVFLLWTKGIDSQEVNEPCSSLDIIPTLSNLLGLEYDSRLLMGRDIFSDKEHLVLFQNRSWITDKAMFNSETGEMTVLNNSGVDLAYKEKITQEVKDKFKYSALILDTDYYRYFKDAISPPN
ncbi:MAG: phosphoglycerol transferase family protein alkaline phosphatase superfamily [Bacillota bacterium]|nr:phosphoglycerol transferase family protein alkaline phosphatase superfamily [Bacillota bacterium]